MTSIAPKSPKLPTRLALPTLLNSTIAPRASVDSLSLQFATYRRPQVNPLWCELADTDGSTLACAQVDATQIQDNAFHKILDLRHVKLVVGTTYRVRITAALLPDAADNHYVAAWVIPAEPQYAEFVRTLISFRADRRFISPTAGSDESARTSACVLAIPSDLDAAAVRDAMAVLHSAFPGQPFELIELARPVSFWPDLAKADVVVFAGRAPTPDVAVGFDALCFALHRRGTCTIYLTTPELPTPSPTAQFRYCGELDRSIRAKHHSHRRCHFYLLDYPTPQLYHSVTDAPIESARSAGEPAFSLGALLERIRKPRLPHVAIVSVLHQKSNTIDAFMDHIVRQSYVGAISVVLVDDASPDDDLDRAQAYVQRLAALGPSNRDVVIVRNERNLGNCASRLAGLAAVEAEIYVIVDCDCLLNMHFVAAHVFEHASPGVDVVVGPLNIESHDRRPGRARGRA